MSPVRGVTGHLSPKNPERKMEIASETQGKTKDSDVTGQSLQKPEST